MQSIVSFLAGVIGGIVALFIAVVLEIILSILGKPPLSLAENPLLLIILLIPALLEETTKVTVAKRILDQWGNTWAIVGTGIGFGLAEIYILLGTVPFRWNSAMLPLVHSAFLIGGFFIAKYLAKEQKKFYFQWLIASTLLHWGYNVAQVVFLLKP